LRTFSNWHRLALAEIPYELYLAQISFVSASILLKYSNLGQLTFPRPGLRYSVAGLINSLVSIYTAHDGFWSMTAIVTTAVTGAYLVVMLVLYWVCNKHHREAKMEFKETIQRSEQVD
jgi:hypothetical protein